MRFRPFSPYKTDVIFDVISTGFYSSFQHSILCFTYNYNNTTQHNDKQWIITRRSDIIDASLLTYFPTHSDASASYYDGDFTHHANSYLTKPGIKFVALCVVVLSTNNLLQICLTSPWQRIRGHHFAHGLLMDCQPNSRQWDNESS